MAFLNISRGQVLLDIYRYLLQTFLCLYSNHLIVSAWPWPARLHVFIHNSSDHRFHSVSSQACERQRSCIAGSKLAAVFCEFTGHMLAELIVVTPVTRCIAPSCCHLQRRDPSHNN